MTHPKLDEAALKADPSDSEIMEIAGRWFHTGENQHRADGYYYRSLGTPTNVRGSDLIEFARALLHRSQPVAVVENLARRARPRLRPDELPRGAPWRPRAAVARRRPRRDGAR